MMRPPPCFTVWMVYWGDGMCWVCARQRSPWWQKSSILLYNLDSLTDDIFISLVADPLPHHFFLFTCTLHARINTTFELAEAGLGSFHTPVRYFPSVVGGQEREWA
ncbi:hypothetical protein ATANTOWER_020276 [Ataeniobius toweri]|uniref:Uncharacterized protein n=1 Tax=Ataeniobius toweri TaxID=208326 RepID=A0ABU7C2Z9_9TELE|nr:hypothetical protein [Ataeniobius toweri]